MSKQELTPWIDGNVEPVRDGVYERLYDEGKPQLSPAFCLFSKGLWKAWGGSPDRASKEECVSALQHLPWRGLTSPSKEAA